MKRVEEQIPCQYVEESSKSYASKPYKLIRLFQSDLFIDLLSCIFLSAGLGSAVLTLTNFSADFSGGFWSAFAFACASTLITAVFSLRWWIAPASAAALLSAAALYHWFAGSLEAAASYWAGFFAWALRGAPYDALYSENGGVILKAAIVFTIALICFILVRKLFFLPVILLFACAVSIAAYCLARADLSVPLCVCAAGLVILLPRVYSRYVSLRSTGAEHRGAMQVVTVPAAVLAALLALWLIPEDTSDWKSYRLSSLASDIVYLFEGPFSSYPPISSGFSMDKLGFSRESGLLGGPVKLSDEEFLYVETSSPMLLRGAVMDYYTGESWLPGAADGDFRFEGLFWRGYRNSAFGHNKPSASGARKLFEQLTAEQGLTVNYHSDQFNTVFAGGILRDARFKNIITSVPIYFNMRSEMYLHYRIPNQVQLQVKARVWNQDSPGFEENFLLLEELSANRGDKDFPQVSGRYTRLPDALPGSVRELATQITAGSASPYQKASAIKRWLGENCEYTLEPAVPPENADFVGHFLDTRQGYCTYYASAMAVLARCAGLPSRYVTGFGLERDEENAGWFYATGKTAHAWAEIYFDGIGWLEFDPLGWDPAAPLNSGQPDLSAGQPQLAFAPPPTPADEGAPDKETETGTQESGGVSPVRVLSFAAVFVILYFISRLTVKRIMGRKGRMYDLARVSRKIPGLSKRMDFYFDDILKQLSLLGISAYTGETLTGFSARADRYIKFEGLSFTEVAQIQMHMHFAEIEPRAEDCETAFRYHCGLESLLRERLSKMAYFLKRAVRR